ncbi:MAG: DUF4157 domain-containing protein, partial [Myxococcales bacterium]|nr:DUF4157 domain-containing protein [Myxococcales bacterium]
MHVNDDKNSEHGKANENPAKHLRQQRLDAPALIGGFQQASAGSTERPRQSVEKRESAPNATLSQMTSGVADVLNDWVSDATAGPATLPASDGGRNDTVARHQSGKGHEPSSDSISHYASAGLQGGRIGLPYQGQLERSFGMPLGDIPVYQGARSTEAARAMNADAYAFRGSIVLGDRSDMRTVAEETAHVLQSRGGGMDSAGRMTDPAGSIENEASSVADAVSSGQSVGGLSQGLGSETVARTPTMPKGSATDYDPTGKKGPLLGGGGQGSSRQVQNYQSSSTEDLLKDKMDPKEFDTYKGTVAKKAGDLSESQATAHTHAQGAIYEDRITNSGTVGKDGKQSTEGKDGQGVTQLSKVLGGTGAITGMLTGERSAVGGSIGYAETTEGRSALETKQMLGLDYNAPGYNPFMKDDKDLSQGFNDQGLTLVKFGMTDEMKDAARVSTGGNMTDHVKKLADKGDKLAQFPTFNTQDPKANDAYRGTGTTGTSELVDGLDTMNQELTFAQADKNKPGEEKKAFLSLPDGSEMIYRDKAGDDALIATLKTDEKTGKQNWEYNAELAKTKPDVLMQHVQMELSGLTDKVQKATDLQKKTGDEVQKLDGEQKKKKGEVAKLEGEVSGLKAQVSSADDKTKPGLQTKLNEKEQALSKAKQALSELDTKLAEAKTKADEAKTEFEKWKGKLDERKPTLDKTLADCQAAM